MEPGMQENETSDGAGQSSEIDETGDQNTAKFLTFSLHGESFGVEVMRIKEILEYCAVTKVPMAPSFIKGVLNLRGRVVPVVDLSVRLGKGKSQQTRRTCILVMEVESDGDTVDVGVMVDAVNEVLDLSVSDIETTPAFGADIEADYIEGMGRVDHRFVYLLHVERVLSIEELADWSN